MCQKSHPYGTGLWTHETWNKWLQGATAWKVVWVFLPLGNANHLAYLPRKKKGSIHQTSSKFELHMTMPNRCSSFYSPIKRFALLFCALHSCFAQKTGMDSCSDVLCRKQKFTCSSTWDSNSPEGKKKASVYSLSTGQGKGFMFWWFCAGIFLRKITCSAARHGILIHHQGKKAISYSWSTSHFPTPWNEHHDPVGRE
jgi:hypothetical protein